MPQHPETAARVAVLAQCHLLQHPRVSLLQPPAAAEISSQLETVLQLVHPAGYLMRLQEICSSLQSPTMVDDSTYIAPGSYTACCEVGASTSSSCDCRPPFSRPPNNMRRSFHMPVSACTCLCRCSDGSSSA